MYSRSVDTICKQHKYWRRRLAYISAKPARRRTGGHIYSNVLYNVFCHLVHTIYSIHERGRRYLFALEGAATRKLDRLLRLYDCRKIYISGKATSKFQVQDQSEQEIGNGI